MQTRYVYRYQLMHPIRCTLGVHGIICGSIYDTVPSRITTMLLQYSNCTLLTLLYYPSPHSSGCLSVYMCTWSPSFLPHAQEAEVEPHVHVPGMSGHLPSPGGCPCLDGACQLKLLWTLNADACEIPYKKDRVTISRFWIFFQLFEIRAHHMMSPKK
jgi:hypothetical protein